MEMQYVCTNQQEFEIRIEGFSVIATLTNNTCLSQPGGRKTHQPGALNYFIQTISQLANTLFSSHQQTMKQVLTIARVLPHGSSSVNEALDSVFLH